MNNISQKFTIKDLENISGVKAHTIRIWEKRYNLLKPDRSETNIRFYSNDCLQKLLNVALLNNNGIKISKIAQMTDNDVLLQVRELALKCSFEDQAINSLKLSMYQFDKLLFDTVYSQLIQKISFREVFKDVFVPFLRSVGLLWQTDAITPAHEHFISNLIIQKIQFNTEVVSSDVIQNSKTYVLFLPENEIHDLGLLYVNYELILRGYKTIYLGQNISLENLSYFIESEEPINFITNLTVRPYEDELPCFLQKIQLLIQDTNHHFSILGRRVVGIENQDFEFEMELYPSLMSFLKTL